MFYRKPLNPDGSQKLRYGKQPLGINKLGGLMEEMCEKGDLIGNFSNHSGKRTCATSLYRAGVDEQEIMERTGHRSTAAVRAYKTSSGNIQKRVSNVLNPPVENPDKENSPDPPLKTLKVSKVNSQSKESDEKSGKRCLNDVTNMQGGHVTFKNCNFSFN